jgi:hypothetical protein
MLGAKEMILFGGEGTTIFLPTSSINFREAEPEAVVHRRVDSQAIVIASENEAIFFLRLLRDLVPRNDISITLHIL